jgi:hypothetical protein
MHFSFIRQSCVIDVSKDVLGVVDSALDERFSDSALSSSAFENNKKTLRSSKKMRC